MTIEQLLKGMNVKSRRKVLAMNAFVKEHLADSRGFQGNVRGEEIATILAEATMDPDLICIALLSDIHVHPAYERLLKIAPLTGRQRTWMQHLHERQSCTGNGNSTMRQAVRAIANDVELLPLLLARRIAEIRHIDSLPAQKRRQLATESLYVYTAIADRLGIYRWRSEMEERCFPFVHRRIATQLLRKLRASHPKDAACLRHVQTFIGTKLQKAKIRHSIQSRIKGLYSIYRKMMTSQKTFHDLHDRLALRVIVDTVEDCYRTLGIIHSCAHHVAGTLKDYISTPKENSYKSIHTVIYPLPGIAEQKIEIQIRTWQMHEECEYGPAIHHQYKYGTYARAPRLDTSRLLSNLRTVEQSQLSPQKFAQTIASYYRDPCIVVFDGDSRLYHLPQPATVLDFLCFAYGKRCAQATSVRVNRVRRPLSTALADGDVIEATFAKQSMMRSDWLRYCKHLITKDFIHTLLRF